jgi:hypothetical protein
MPGRTASSAWLSGPRRREGGGGILQPKPGEEPELDQPGLHRVLGGQPGQCLVERQQVLVRQGAGESGLYEVDPGQRPPALLPALAAGVLDQDPSHGFGRGGEEVAAAVPARVAGADEPEVRLVDQGGGLEGLAWLLLGQLAGGQLPQFVVDQGQEPRSGSGIASLDGREDVGDVIHRRSRSSHRPGTCPSAVARLATQSVPRARVSSSPG